jgi:hypothetical protein
MATKQLIIVSGEIKGEVEICETDSLKDVQALILEEFDDDMLSCSSSDGAFCFHVNDIRIAHKQEECKMAWNLVSSHDNNSNNNPIIVSLHSKQQQKWSNNDNNNNKRKLETTTTAMAMATTPSCNSQQSSSKRERHSHDENQNHIDQTSTSTTKSKSPQVVESSSNASNTNASMSASTHASTHASASASSTTGTTKDASFYSVDSKEEAKPNKNIVNINANANATAQPTMEDSPPMPCKRLNYQEKLNTATTTTNTTNNTTPTKDDEDTEFYLADDDEITVEMMKAPDKEDTANDDDDDDNDDDDDDDVITNDDNTNDVLLPPPLLDMNMDPDVVVVDVDVNVDAESVMTEQATTLVTSTAAFVTPQVDNKTTTNTRLHTTAHNIAIQSMDVFRIHQQLNHTATFPYFLQQPFSFFPVQQPGVLPQNLLRKRTRAEREFQCLCEKERYAQRGRKKPGCTRHSTACKLSRLLHEG